MHVCVCAYVCIILWYVCVRVCVYVCVCVCVCVCLDLTQAEAGDVFPLFFLEIFLLRVGCFLAEGGTALHKFSDNILATGA